MSSDLADELQIVGTHEFRFIPPRRVLFVMRGRFDDEHVVAYTEFLKAHAERCGQPLEGLFDMSAATGMTPSARTRLIKRDRTYPYSALAIVGARFSIRTLTSMIFRAGKIVAPQRFAFPAEFFDSVQDAHAWFDELRVKRG